MMCSGRSLTLEMIKKTPASYGVQNIMQCLVLAFGMKLRIEVITDVHALRGFLVEVTKRLVGPKPEVWRSNFDFNNL